LGTGSYVSSMKILGCNVLRSFIFVRIFSKP
jgi:hypothetical protein